MKFAVIAYGNQDEWGKHFQHWHASFTKHNPGADCVVITDGESPWTTAHTNGLPLLRVPDANKHWTFSNLNMSGILMAYAAIHLSPVLVMTLDCEVRRKIEPGPWTEQTIAIGEDPAQRERTIDGFTFVEGNNAVQWCNLTWHGRNFLHVWDGLIDHDLAHRCPFFEQVVWSGVTKGHPRYPRELNWSHWWDKDEPDNPEIVIYHRHGTKKNEIQEKQA